MYPMYMRKPDLEIGRIFGRLTVTGPPMSGEGLPGGRKYPCKCECGKEMVARRAWLVAGHSKSCGCLHDELAGERLRRAVYRHGEASNHKGEVPTPEYRAWGSMVARCTRPTHAAFARYGGRGITICAEWRNSYPAFIRDVGRRPSPAHSLDRIDNERGYEPGNVRWATWLEQNNNRSKLHLIAAFGKTISIMAWSRELGIPRGTIQSRVDRGLDGVEALTPSRRNKTR